MGKSDEFIDNGLQKYLDAASAVNIFEEEIQKRVKSVVENRWSALSEFLDGGSSLSDYRYSSDLPESMQIGQQVPFKGHGRLYFYLVFSRCDNGDPRVSPAVCLSRARLGAPMQPLWDAVTANKAQFLNENLGISNYSIWMTSGKPCTGWDSCKDVFDEVIDGWIGFWKGLGGIEKYLVS